MRYAPDGSLERSYGNAGVVDVGSVDTGDNLARLLDGPGDATTLWWVPRYAPDPGGRAPRAGILRITPAGRLGAPTRLAPPFGGGRAPDPGETAGSLAQNSFAGDLLLRPDSSYLVVGGVSIAETDAVGHRRQHRLSRGRGVHERPVARSRIRRAGRKARGEREGSRARPHAPPPRGGASGCG